MVLQNSIYEPIFEVKEESFVDCLGELEPIFDEHYKEISRHARKGIELAPDLERYAVLEANDELLFISFRFHGDLVGYINCIVGRPLHYKVRQMMLDLIYVKKQYRGKLSLIGQTAGDLLILKAKELGQKKGAVCFTAGAKAKALPHFKKLLERHDFEPFEYHFIHWFK